MAKWERRTYDYGKKGKIIIDFDDSTPRIVKKVTFEDPDGTVRVFDRTAYTVTITKKGKEPETHKCNPPTPGGKTFTYEFTKDDWVIEVDDKGGIEWKKKVGKKGETTEKIEPRSKPTQGEWTHDDGTKDKPEKESREDIDNPHEKKP